MTRAWGSPLRALASTTGASRAKPAAPNPSATTAAFSSWGVHTPRACQSWFFSAVSLSRPSAIWTLTARPSRPRSIAEPAPSRSQPQPPVRCQRPQRVWPRAMQPVPLITRTPGSSPRAPSRAVCSSPLTCTEASGSLSAAAAKASPWLWIGLPRSMPLAPTPAAARG